MKLDLPNLAHLCPFYRHCPALTCDCLMLSSSSGVSHCEAIIYASFAFNILRDISPFALCRNLWVLDLRANRVGDVGPLAAFAALGTVVLASNPLVPASLVKLRHVHILNLTLPSGCDYPSLPRNYYIGVWTLNNTFLLESEVADSELSVRQDFCTQVSELAQRVIHISSISDIRLRTKSKIEFLWSDCEMCGKLQEKTYTIGAGRPSSIRTQTFTTEAESWYKLDRYVQDSIALVLNLCLEGLVAIEGVVALLRTVIPLQSSLLWVKDLPSYSLLGIALKMQTVAGREELTLEDVMCREFIRDSGATRREKKIATLARELLVRVNSWFDGFSDCEEVETVRTVLRQSVIGIPEVSITDIENYEEIAKKTERRLEKRYSRVHSAVERRKTGIFKVNTSMHWPAPIVTKPDRYCPVGSMSLSTSNKYLLNCDSIITQQPKSSTISEILGKSTIPPPFHPSTTKPRPKTAGMNRSFSLSMVKQRQQTQQPKKQKRSDSSFFIKGKGEKSVPCVNINDHFNRVFSREATPWVAYRYRGQKRTRKESCL